MANRFTESFGQGSMQQPQVNIASAIGQIRQNPNQFLADQISSLAARGINVPEQYQNNPELVARYLLQNSPGLNQNKVFQTVGMLRSMLGFR